MADDAGAMRVLVQDPEHENVLHLGILDMHCFNEYVAAAAIVAAQPAFGVGPCSKCGEDPRDRSIA